MLDGGSDQGYELQEFMQICNGQCKSILEFQSWDNKNKFLLPCSVCLSSFEPFIIYVVGT